MTPEKFKNEMRKLKNYLDQGYGFYANGSKMPYDYEAYNADVLKLMAKVLREKGYGEGVDVYGEVYWEGII